MADENRRARTRGLFAPKRTAGLSRRRHHCAMTVGAPFAQPAAACRQRATISSSCGTASRRRFGRACNFPLCRTAADAMYAPVATRFHQLPISCRTVMMGRAGLPRGRLRLAGHGPVGGARREGDGETPEHSPGRSGAVRLVRLKRLLTAGRKLNPGVRVAAPSRNPRASGHALEPHCRVKEVNQCWRDRWVRQRQLLAACAGSPLPTLARWRTTAGAPAPAKRALSRR